MVDTCAYAPTRHIGAVQEPAATHAPSQATNSENSNPHPRSCTHETTSAAPTLSKPIMLPTKLTVHRQHRRCQWGGRRHTFYFCDA